MATREDLYPSPWLKATNVETPVTATIDRCTIEMVGQGATAERKPVLYFRDGIKPCVLNQTNFTAVASAVGREDCDDWAGGIVELFAADVQFKNDMVRAVRIRKPRRPKARTAAPMHRDDVDEDEMEF